MYVSLTILFIPVNGSAGCGFCNHISKLQSECTSIHSALRFSFTFLHGMLFV